MVEKGWIGVDLDGTLAQYDEWRGAGHIGEPVPLMLARVKEWIEAGEDVRIVTARVSPNNAGAEESAEAIGVWLQEHAGRQLPVVCNKDMYMVELWDDRAKQVVPNTGVAVADQVAELRQCLLDLD